MSTSVQSPIDTESKQQDSRSSKDDYKQQAALSRGKSKQSDSSSAPVDAGSSLVGGAVAAMQSAVDKGIHMLPESMQAKAEALEESAKAAIGRAADIAAPVVESYQHDGIIAAAKAAGHIGAGAVSSATGAAKASASSTATNLKSSVTDKASGIASSVTGTASNIKASVSDKIELAKSTAAGAASSIKTTAVNLGTQATDAASALKQKVTGAAPEAPHKHHGRRRRGGRGHGNRKMKLREVKHASAESIVDSLGDKAKEIQEVVVEDIAAAQSQTGGIVGTVKGAVGSVTSGISNTVSSATSRAGSIVAGAQAQASGLVQGATSKASNLVQGAQAQASGLVHGATEKVAATLASAKGMVTSAAAAAAPSMQRKPSLERQQALPALGSPMTPGDSPVVTHTTAGKLAAKPDDQSSLIDKAKFAAGAAKDYVADKIDALSMNADDSSPMEGAGGKLDGAKKQLKDMAESIKEGVQDAIGHEKDSGIKQ